MFTLGIAMRRWLNATGTVYLLALAATAAAVLARWAADPWLGVNLPLVTLFGVVAGVVWLGGYRPALVAAVVGYLACEALFVLPRREAGFGAADGLGLVLYVLTCTLIIGLGEGMRLARRRDQEGRELLRVTFASIGDGVITTDTAGRVTYLNAVAESLTGWKQADAAGRPLEEVFRIVNEQTRRPVESPVERSLREGAVVGLANHTVLITREGKERPIDDSAAPVRDDAGRVVGCVLIFRDITERRRAERARWQLAAIIESATDAVFNKDLNGVIRSWNRGAEHLYGYAADEAVGQSIALLIPPERADELARIMERVRRGERVEPLETVRIRKGGGRVEVSVTVSPVHNDAGEVVGASVIARDATERKQAAEALRESERQLRRLADTMPQIVWAARPDGYIDYYNERWYEFTGFPRGEFGQPSWEPILHPDDVRRCVETYFGCVAAGTSYQIEYRFKDRKTGGYRWFLGRAEPVRDERGRVVRWFGTCTDIDDTKRAEEALRESEHRLRLALEAGRMGTWEWDVAANRVSWSPGLEEIHGLAAGTFAGTFEAFQRDIHPDDRDRVLGAVRDSLERGVDHHVEYRIVWPDRSVRWVEGRGKLFHDPSGTPVRMVGVCTDVTDRKRAEEALWAKEAELELVTDTTPLILTRCSRDLRYLFANRAAAALFGLTPRQMVGRPIAEILGEGVFATIRPHVERVLRGEAVEYEAQIRYPGVGPRWVRVNYIPERDAAGAVSGWVASIIDVTELKRAEEALREADRRKDEFLATLSHELRNPLAPIRNAVQVLLARDLPDADLRWARELIDRQVRHMARLLEDLLDVSRISHGKLEARKERVELAAVVGAAVEAARPLIDARKHELSVSLPAEPVYLDADPVRLAQVFSNLLTNAAKYTEPGGRIALAAVVGKPRSGVRGQESGVTEQRSEVRGQRSESAGAGSELTPDPCPLTPELTPDSCLLTPEVTVSVRDDGMGIDPEGLAQIFTMFSQPSRGLERSQGGLGIGLSLVRGLVELHGGRIEARSDGPGKGSEFVVTLSVAGQLAAPAAAQEAAEEARAWRFLIVDDLRESADSLAMLLRVMGHEADTAYDGEEGVAAAERVRPEIVLLDLGMPRLNGYDACRRIRQQPWGAGMVLIALTGWGRESDRQQTGEAGFDHHLVKPVDPKELLEAVAAVERTRTARGA